MVKKNFLKSSLIMLVVLAIALLPMASVKAAIDRADDPSLVYSAHVQNVGWTLASKAGVGESEVAESLAGSEGKSQRLEALKVTFTAPTGATLSCNAHVQGIGWTGWTKLEGKDVLIGTEGQSKRLEAIKFSVTGLKGFEIKYRAHVQGYGWMDWVTADDSTDVTSNFVGTKGECKRIEAIEVLILKTADAELFDAHQAAIKAVKEFVTNRGTYTFNANKVEKRLNECIAYINTKTTSKDINDAVVAIKSEFNGYLTDEEIYAKTETVRNAIDSWVKECLSGEIQGKSENGTYANVPIIKAAIEDAKANLLTDTTKTEYVATDFATSQGNNLYSKALRKIDLAVAKFGLEKVNELYAKEVTSLTDMVIGEKAYNDALSKLNLKDGAIDEDNIPYTTPVVQMIDGLKADCTLQKVIDYRKGTLNTFVTANYETDLTNNFTKIKEAISDVASVTKLKDVSYIANAIKAGTDAIDAARSTKAVVEAYESAKAGTVTALRGFINRTISVLTTMGNVSGKLLETKDVTPMRDVMNETYKTVDAEAKALADAYKTMLDTIK